MSSTTIFRQSWTRSWMSSTKTTGGTVDSTIFIVRRPDPNPAVFLEKTTSPVHYSQGQKSSKFLWWTASLECLDYQRGLSWVGRGVRAEAKIYFSNIVLKNFNHAGFRQKCKMASKKSSQKQLLQFTAPKAKNRQNFGGEWPPGMFIED